MKEQSTMKSLITMAMFSAVLAVLSVIQVPMPSGVPITLQTFAVALCGYVLGWKMGAGAAALYMLIGAIGVPVFAGMTSGMGVVLGPTGGFLWGFIIFAGVCGLGMKQRNRILQVVCGIGGLLVCHMLGILQFSLVTGNGLWQSALIASIPYLIKDILSVAGALLAALILRKQLAAAGVMVYGKAA